MKAITRKRFKPYPAYKDSGVEWLGEIPAHWEVKPFKALLSRNDSGVWGEDSADDGTIILRSTEQTVDGRWLIETPARRLLSAREAAQARLEVDDLVVTKSSGSDLHIGKTCIVDESVAALDCGFSNFMQRLRVHLGHRPRYFWHLLNSPVAREQLVFLSSTTTGLGNLNGSVLGAVRVPAASHEEQRAIAAFLDRVTGRIDALVAKKERLIELLQEKRTALITRAVTKGLDPNVPMKDSGFEWLGEIPAHWEVKRIRHVVSHIEQGWSPECENREADAEEWGVLKAGCVNRGSFVEAEHKALPSTLEPIPELEIAEGDLLMSRASGSRELVGSVAVVPKCRKRLLLCDKLFRLIVDGVNSGPHILAYAMNSRIARWQIEAVLSGGSGLANNIPQKAVKDLVLALPAADEQPSIVAFLDHETATIDALIAKVREAIARLKELRTALISAAVTGKIDVRGEVA